MAPTDPFFWFDDPETNKLYQRVDTHGAIAQVEKIGDRKDKITDQWGETEFTNQMLAHYAHALGRLIGTIPGEKDEGVLSSAETFAGKAMDFAVGAKATGGNPVLINTVIRRATKVLSEVAKQRERNGGKAHLSDKMMEFLKDPSISPFVPWDDFSQMM